MLMVSLVQLDAQHKITCSSLWLQFSQFLEKINSVFIESLIALLKNPTRNFV